MSHGGFDDEKSTFRGFPKNLDIPFNPVSAGWLHQHTAVCAKSRKRQRPYYGGICCFHVVAGTCGPYHEEAHRRQADIIDISKGKTGIGLARDLDRVTFYDVYKAVDYSEERCIFHFHENPNPACPVGANIHGALDEKLIKVQEAMENEMKKITVADVTAGIHRAMCK